MRHLQPPSVTAHNAGCELVLRVSDRSGAELPPPGQQGPPPPAPDSLLSNCTAAWRLEAGLSQESVDWQAVLGTSGPVEVLARHRTLILALFRPGNQNRDCNEPCPARPAPRAGEQVSNLANFANFSLGMLPCCLAAAASCLLRDAPRLETFCMAGKSSPDCQK